MRRECADCSVRDRRQSAEDALPRVAGVESEARVIGIAPQLVQNAGATKPRSVADVR